MYTPPAGLASGVQDKFTYTLSNGVGTATGTVNLLAEEWPITPALNIVKVEDATQGKWVTFAAIPNLAYDVYATSTLSPANWVGLGSFTADSKGVIRINDLAAGTNRFYKMRSRP